MTAKINFTSNTIDIGIVTTNDFEMLHFYQEVLGFDKEIEIPFPGIGVVNKLSYGAGYIKILVLERVTHQTLTLLGIFLLQTVFAI